MKGLVSIIIPVHNRSDDLRCAVDTVLAQTYMPIEIIVVDDGSTDDTSIVIDRLAEQNNGVIHVIHQENKGVGLARQAGLCQTKGEFIQFLDSDDVLLPRKFELQVAGLQANPDCDISYGKTRAYHVDFSGPEDIPSRATGERFERLLPRIVAERPWHTVTPLYRRSALKRIGPWTALRQAEDWEYDMRLAVLGVKLHYCDDFIAEQRHHSGERLCLGWVQSDAALRDRAEGMLLIQGHAAQAGVASDTPEMQRLAADLLFWARRCAGRGLVEEAERLFDCGSGILSRQGISWRAYRHLARLVGWRNAERLAGLVKGRV